MTNWNSAYQHFMKAKEVGFSSRLDKKSNQYYITKHAAHGISYLQRNSEFKPPYRAKEGSHDDGPFNGPFLGGIGTSNFSRDFMGVFSRWQLQQGVHQMEAMEPAFFMVRWRIGSTVNYKRIRIGDQNFSQEHMEYAALFPLCYEYYTGDDLPFELLMEYYSPTIPHNYQDSCLPITCFNFYIKSKLDTDMEVSIGLVWPNLVGWRQSFLPTEVRRDMQWPSQQYAGNTGQLMELSDNRCHLVQYKQSAVKQIDDMLGNVVISLEGKNQWNISYKPCFRANQITTGVAEQEQKYTIAHVEKIFKEHGELDNDQVTWHAHWHEAIASAVAAKSTLSAEEEKSLLISLTMDMPVTSFGGGRKWFKAYTEQFGTDGLQSLKLAEKGLDSNEKWLQDIKNWHKHELAKHSNLPPKVAGALLNELHFVVAGGSVWITKPVDGHQVEKSLLEESWHYGLLEGFDTGYYYYNTLDLWVYAFSALSVHWPKLSDNVFNDFLASAIAVDERKHMVYRTATLESNLAYGKLPHDMGSAPEDPWVQLNGYVHRDDPNLWKDHNPAFINAYYLHKRLMGSPISREEYGILVEIAKFTSLQDKEDIGVPKHTDFGDSTWDNLDMKGLSTYAAGLCIGAWAVMAELAKDFDPASVLFYRDKLTKAQKSIDTLWNGRYYKTNDLGKYHNAVMTDSLFGVFMAKKAGLGDLIPLEKAVSHLKSIYEINYLAYEEGKYGPLLVAEPGRQQYSKDGGEELQVNEVLVGSAWMFTAMLYQYGLAEEAKRLAETLSKMIYQGTGLQFRTPAAWDSQGNYRAPLNMRPLAIWLLNNS